MVELPAAPGPIPQRLMEQAEAVSALLKCLAHPQRLMIACLLAGQPCAVSEIEARLGIHQPSLSQHLGALREAGVISGTRHARTVTYRLGDTRAGAVLAALAEIFCRDADAAPDAHAGAVAPPAPGLAGAAHFARVLAAVR